MARSEEVAEKWAVAAACKPHSVRIGRAVRARAGGAGLVGGVRWVAVGGEEE